MNKPNPFLNQGSLSEQKNRKRDRARIAILSVFGGTILLMSILLFQGCKKEAPSDADTLKSSFASDTNTGTNLPDTNTLTLPATSTNGLASTSSNTPPSAPEPVAPPVVQQPVAPEPAPASEYVVAKGDSYYSIAKKFGVKIKQVEAANPGISPNKLKVGQKLQIPSGGSSSGVGSSSVNSASGSSIGSDSGETYTVKSGDSLTKIAKSNGVSVRALRANNDLKTDKIKVGQKLKIPSKAASVDNTAPVPSQPVPQTAPPAPVSAPAPSSGVGH